ncbi:MAG TPA: 50S ribosomal protein L21 [Candidatus Limnocylindria bacterium]|nr:50S ribosomal protein L21 [Candidatus Limnocylindria bacterium]
MYAVVTTGGKQYRVEPGSELEVERLSGDAGSSVTFDRVLLVGDGEAVTIGTPTVEGATVSGTVLGETLGPKLIIFKFKQKATYRRKNGHRQHLTRVRIDEINASGKKAKADKAENAGKATKADKDEKADAVEAAATEKPKRTRKTAEKPASAEVEKPKRTRKAATKKSAEE